MPASTYGSGYFNPGPPIPRQGWQPVDALGDPISTSGTAPVRISQGRYRFTVPGGAATPHPSAGIFAIFDLRDILGRTVGVGPGPSYNQFDQRHLIVLHTKPALTSDSYVRIGFSDKNSIAPAGYIGLDTEMQFTGGNEVVTSALELFGNVTAFRTPYAGPYANANKNVWGKWGQVRSDDTYRPTAWTEDALDQDTGEFVLYPINPPLNGGNGGGFIYIAAGRTAATAGDAVIEASFYHFTLNADRP